MYKIAMIGDKDSVLGFMAAGFAVQTTNSPEEAVSALHRLAKNDYAIIFITESIASQIAEEIEKYENQPIPAIIAIPDKSGSTGYGITRIKQSVEKAIGADILFKNDN